MFNCTEENVWLDHHGHVEFSRVGLQSIGPLLPEPNMFYTMPSGYVSTTFVACYVDGPTYAQFEADCAEYLLVDCCGEL